MGIEEDEVSEKKYVVAYDSLCEQVDRCTCGAGPGGYHGAHEPGCGLEFIASLEQIFDALSAQPSPEVPAGAEVAEVLAGRRVGRALGWLVRLKDGPRDEGYRADKPHAWAKARAAYTEYVEAVQAATGARSAGGEPTFEMIERGAGAAYEHQRVVADPMDHGPWENVKKRRWAYQQDSYKRWYEIAEAVLLAAAPPAPSAPGVAALLAEARRRQAEASAGGALMSCWEIVRMLAPGGADGEREGT